MNEIILDLETQNPFQFGNKNTKDLKISLVGIYHYGQNQFLAFPEEKLGELWPLLEHADRIIGYNIKGFDFPVLNNYYSGNMAQFPALDIMDIIYQKLGFRVSLDDVARSTLNIGKTGDGLKAIKLFREGKMDELCDYCLQDVRLTRDLYEYGKKHGKLLYENKLGKGEIAVDFNPSRDQRHSINFTLPI
ncbi:MAG: hypothetical protein COT24_03910 [Candidatus Kerfeldbacteria bacterium CG08_land_8_20_14_0_20_40_16]|uniref:YprB ribonuclease H-like domain-containing protein n=1 Tax=Candidatus Kerfeldbacteria bacterium CG08_land_8_20_14_0_20_40_16 TaxID=2014244 RepID=A0A2H0YVM4_9BACT|nr:MAG: hypothetical protein COT24_03910 [Candidatus Kerfeldbacteria bacterium CG08_land_8_20_14_0_20_40_16]